MKRGTVADGQRPLADTSQDASADTRRNAPGRTLVRAIAFVCAACALVAYLNAAFVIKGSAQNRGNFDAFSDLPADTVDVAYIGSSSSSRFYINPKAFNDYGIASYTFGPQGCPAYFIKYLIKEMERSQDPQLYVIELRGTRKSPYSVEEGDVRTTLDTIGFLSPNRFDMAGQAAKYCVEGGDDLGNYLFPIAKYHSRLLKKDMKPEDFKLVTPYNVMQGYYTSKPVLTQASQDPGAFTTAIGQIDDEAVAVLDDLAEFCDSLDKDVLFVLAPCSASDNMFKQMNATAAIMEAHGFPVLNCNSDDICDRIGLDWSTDFYNRFHTNYLGAEKYTRFFSEYLKDHYDIPDRRGEAGYGAWADGYQAYEDYVSQGILYYKDQDVEDE